MGYASGTFLINMGLTNRDQEDFGNIQMALSNRHMPEPYCSSRRCTVRQDEKGRIVVGKDVKKKVPRNSVYCPDCGYCLHWE